MQVLAAHSGFALAEKKPPTKSLKKKCKPSNHHYHPAQQPHPHSLVHPNSSASKEVMMPMAPPPPNKVRVFTLGAQ
jgi:hypothetical protein